MGQTQIEKSKKKKKKWGAERRGTGSPLVVIYGGGGTRRNKTMSEMAVTLEKICHLVCLFLLLISYFRQK